MKSVFCTREFRIDLKRFSRARETIATKLNIFIAFRQTHPDRLAFNADDTYYGTDSPLRGFRHVHLHHGKCIVVYKTTADSILLLAMCDHQAEDAPRALSNYLNNISATDLAPFAEDQAFEPNPELVEAIRNDVFELVASDPDVIRQSLRGDDTLIDYLSARAPAETIMASLGGEEKFDAFLRKALSDYGIHEGMRDWMNIIKEATMRKSNDQFYLRIGDWHPSETSRNYATGKQ